MSHNLTENSANADFTTGLVVPNNGDSGTVWWNVLIDLFQEAADRFQWLKGWQSSTPEHRVNLNPMLNTNARFAAQVPTGAAPFWNQTDVTDAGALYFPVTGLAVGRKITKVTAIWANATNAVAATSIGTPPAVSLIKHNVASGTVVAFTDTSTVVATGTDATAVVADYQKLHNIASATFSETISDSFEYLVKFTGENGANKAAGGTLRGIRLTLGF
jgi:hypothetical protein